jgi:hypothetical protein
MNFKYIFFTQKKHYLKLYAQRNIVMWSRTWRTVVMLHDCFCQTQLNNVDSTFESILNIRANIIYTLMYFANFVKH